MVTRGCTSPLIVTLCGSPVTLCASPVTFSREPLAPCALARRPFRITHPLACRVDRIFERLLTGVVSLGESTAAAHDSHALVWQRVFTRLARSFSLP